MQSSSVDLPHSSQVFERHWGLGWGLLTHRRCGFKIVWHIGEVASQNAMLQLFPEQDIAIVVLLNSAKSGVLTEIVDELVNNLIGIDYQEPECVSIKPTMDEMVVYTGMFESFDAVYDISVSTELTNDDQNCSGLTLEVVRTDKLYKNKSELSWSPIGKATFASHTKHGARLSNVIFLNKNAENIPESLMVGGRLNQRISPPYQPDHKEKACEY